MAPESAAMTTTGTESPYKLDKPQVSQYLPIYIDSKSNIVKVIKASTALLNHIKSITLRKEASSTKQNLLVDPSDSSSNLTSNLEPIWLVLTTKKHIVDQARLKPGKIQIPYSLNSSLSVTICLITADPQRSFKDIIAHPSFPSSIGPRISRVLGLAKLKARYKSFESRRQLLAEYDVFLADSRIITFLPNLLGKIFYKSSKRPVPVNLEPPKAFDPVSKKRISGPKTPKGTAAVAPPKEFGHEIQRALSSALVHLSPAATTSIRVGRASFSPEQLVENVEAVVNGMVEKFITKGWRNVRAIHIKGPNTTALPVWLASELWLDEEDVLEEAEAKDRAEKGKQKGKRPGRETEDAKTIRSKNGDEDMSTEMQERREKLRAQKQEEEDVTAIKDKKAERKRKAENGVDKPRKEARKRKSVDLESETGAIKPKKIRAADAVETLKASRTADENPKKKERNESKNAADGEQLEPRKRKPKLEEGESEPKPKKVKKTKTKVVLKVKG